MLHCSGYSYINILIFHYPLKMRQCFLMQLMHSQYQRELCGLWVRLYGLSNKTASCRSARIPPQRVCLKVFIHQKLHLNSFSFRFILYFILCGMWFVVDQRGFIHFVSLSSCSSDWGSGSPVHGLSAEQAQVRGGAHVQPLPQAPQWNLQNLCQLRWSRLHCRVHQQADSCSDDARPHQVCSHQAVQPLHWPLLPVPPPPQGRRAWASSSQGTSSHPHPNAAHAPEEPHWLLLLRPSPGALPECWAEGRAAEDLQSWRCGVSAVPPESGLWLPPSSRPCPILFCPQMWPQGPLLPPPSGPEGPNWLLPPALP